MSKCRSKNEPELGYYFERNYVERNVRILYMKEVIEDVVTSQDALQPVLVGQPLVIPLLPHGDLEAVLLQEHTCPY